VLKGRGQEKTRVYASVCSGPGTVGAVMRAELPANVTIECCYGAPRRVAKVPASEGQTGLGVMVPLQVKGAVSCCVLGENHRGKRAEENRYHALRAAGRSSAAGLLRRYNWRRAKVTERQVARGKQREARPCLGRLPQSSAGARPALKPSPHWLRSIAGAYCATNIMM
jgi:hypothetical protein